MRTLMKVSIPAAAGSRAVQDGSLPKAMAAFVEQVHPEAAYFTAENGRRTAFFVFDLRDPSMIPSIAEPFFAGFEASIVMSPVMNLEEMQKGVAAAVKRDGGKTAGRPAMQAK